MAANVNSRPGWDSWALGVADAISRRGDCTRRRVGAVILDARNRIIGHGYNGSHPGGPSCLAGECPRGRHYRRTDIESYPYGGPLCACGQPWPCPEAVEPGSSYENCHSIHAESNALIDAKFGVVGSTIYVTTVPCHWCLKLIRGAGIIRAVWRDGESICERELP